MSEAKKLHQNIRLAAKKRSDKEEKWRRHLDFYSKGKHKDQFSTDDEVNIETVYSVVKTLESGLYYAAPHIYLSPRSEQHLIDVRRMEDLTNYEWKDSRVDKEIKRAIRDSLVVGHSWLKSGYIGMSKDKLRKAGQLHTSLRENKLYTIRISPFDMFVDPEARPDNIRWVAQRFYRSKEEVEADPKFKGIKLDINANSLKSIARENGENLMALEETDDEQFQRVEMFEYWDIQKQKVYIIATGTDKILYENKFPKFGFPYEYFALEEDIDEFYGMSPVSKIESLAQELNNTRTQLLNHRKRMKSVILYDPELITKDDMTSITQSDDMSLVAVKDLATRMDGGGQAFTVLETPRIPADLYNTTNLIKQDIRETIAMPEYSMGNAVEGVNTAYEASVIMNAMKMRTDDKMKSINYLCKSVADKHIQIIKHKYKEKVEIPYLDEKGEMAFRYIKATEMRGSFDVDINVEEGIPENAMVRREQELRFFELFAQHPNFDDVELAREVFEAYGKKNFGKIYISDKPQAGAPGTPAMGYGMPSRNNQGQMRGQGSPAEVEPSREAMANNMGAAMGGVQGGGGA